MQKIHYFILLLGILLSGCERENEHDNSTGNKNVTISLRVQGNFNARIVDEDNLAVEQTIKNISLFFTDPSSADITNKYVYTGFTISGDYQLITLPVEASELLVKDIYVVANYNSESTLEGITTITALQNLHTPEVDKANNLNPANGFCMFGKLAGFDFTDEANYPATVPLIRTCAKLRVNLVFPENSTLSTTNSFLIQEAAKYTYIISSATNVLPQTDFFNFAAATPLVDNGAQNYTNIVYIYESKHAPVLTLYTHMNGTTEEQEFTTTLPVPQRNYLYDLRISVYEDTETEVRSASANKSIGYKYDYTLKVYDENGNLIK